MSFKAWLSVVTAALILLTLYFSRHEIVAAWDMMGKVNLWILILLIPLQILSYFAVGAMIFEYLKAKGELKNVGRGEMTKMALELNFVNHVLPSGGVSGFSYMGWRLSKIGINPGKATMAQVVRFAVTFIAYLVLLLSALIFITIDGSVNRVTILLSTLLASTIVFGSLFIVYVIGSETRLKGFSGVVSMLLNKFVTRITWRKNPIIEEEKIEHFFMEMHRDYLTLRQDWGVLRKPLAWGFVFNISDIAMFVVAFAALGVFVNPAALLIAYGLASLAGMLMVTPGGAGAFEAVMLWFLVGAGMAAGPVIAGILLTRVILILGTIVSGYVFYQLALLRYGKQQIEENG
jgi:putative heme transporter